MEGETTEEKWEVETKGGPIRYIKGDEEFNLSMAAQRWKMRDYLNELEAENKRLKAEILDCWFKHGDEPSPRDRLEAERVELQAEIGRLKMQDDHHNHLAGEYFDNWQNAMGERDEYAADRAAWRKLAEEARDLVAGYTPYPGAAEPFPAEDWLERFARLGSDDGMVAPTPPTAS